MNTQSFHWADISADKIIREKGEKEHYTCASGITPSGTVHIGNFREIISVALVAQALKEKGKNTRFIYSWDDYDVFRKVPKNMPKQEELEKHLRMPITLVPDPYEQHESYAEHNEKAVEALLPIVGINPEYIYQAKKYRNSDYAEGMKKALEKRDEIRNILNEHRSSELEENWWPISVFCNNCLHDETNVKAWNGDWELSYSCSHCGNEEDIDLRTSSAVKLLWRIDWPMRWIYEDVDFEPAGKDHHSEGGSFDTAEKVVQQVYNGQAPVTFQYDFIRIKGRGGKISSSTGDVISLTDVLEIYTPELTRFMFAGTRPNSEFAISFDLDVLKIYEDYDKCERIYFTAAENEKAAKKNAKNNRIYELSQVQGVPSELPYQMPIRHLCNLLQINDGDIDGVIQYLGDLKTSQIDRFKKRAQCAWNWITKYAPEDFRFQLQKNAAELYTCTEIEREALQDLFKLIENLDSYSEKDLSSEIYTIAHNKGLDPKDLFTLTYQVLIRRDKGPRLASFIMTIGKEKILNILQQYSTI